ncbi:MAG TPA: cupin domain-containing protein, partial [Cryomorphaceae bacterium]|nr:cupin domain-containing protein [Cryomorphaceae bacterium]
NWLSLSDDNISVEKLAGDSLTTSFLIQIRKDVPLHYHAFHSEHVYIIEGSGEFVLNGDTMTVSEGMYMFIPSESRHSVTVTSAEPMRVLSIQCPEFTGEDRIKVP